MRHRNKTEKGIKVKAGQIVQSYHTIYFLCVLVCVFFGYKYCLVACDERKKLFRIITRHVTEREVGRVLTVPRLLTKRLNSVF